MSAEVQPVWTGLGALLSAGAGLFLLQVCGEALFHGSFLPFRLFLVGFARVCSSHNDAERCEASRGLELELIHCRHWPSAKSRDKERYCTYSEPMERCKCRGGENWSQPNPLRRESSLDSTAWISKSSTVWSHSNHPTQASPFGLFIWDTWVHGPWESYRNQTRLGNSRQQTIFQLQAKLSLPPASFPPHTKKGGILWAHLLLVGFTK